VLLNKSIKVDCVEAEEYIRTRQAWQMMREKAIVR